MSAPYWATASLQKRLHTALTVGENYRDNRNRGWKYDRSRSRICGKCVRKRVQTLRAPAGLQRLRNLAGEQDRRTADGTGRRRLALYHRSGLCAVTARQSPLAPGSPQTRSGQPEISANARAARSPRLSAGCVAPWRRAQGQRRELAARFVIDQRPAMRRVYDGASGRVFAASSLRRAPQERRWPIAPRCLPPLSAGQDNLSHIPGLESCSVRFIRIEV